MAGVVGESSFIYHTKKSVSVQMAVFKSLKGKAIFAVQLVN